MSQISKSTSEDDFSTWTSEKSVRMKDMYLHCRCLPWQTQTSTDGTWSLLERKRKTISFRPRTYFREKSKTITLQRQVQRKSVLNTDTYSLALKYVSLPLQTKPLLNMNYPTKEQAYYQCSGSAMALVRNSDFYLNADPESELSFIRHNRRTILNNK